MKPLEALDATLEVMAGGFRFGLRRLWSDGHLLSIDLSVSQEASNRDSELMGSGREYSPTERPWPDPIVLGQLECVLGGAEIVIAYGLASKALKSSPTVVAAWDSVDGAFIEISGALMTRPG
jgi:hypothetical protein